MLEFVFLLQLYQSELKSITNTIMQFQPGDIITKLDTSSGGPPISNNLFPAPAHVTTVFLEKNPGDAIGIEFKIIRSKTVIVTGIVDGSILSRTGMKIGHEILTVNGQRITTAGQLRQIIRSNRTLEFTLIDKSNPCCYVEVATNSMLHPVVSFERCCNNTMVMIDHVFISGLTKTRLRSGDIVVAVNGIPVWQPEQAREVQIRVAMRSEPFVFYCIDMEQLRDVFISKVPKNICIYEGDGLFVSDDRQYFMTEIVKRNPSTIIIEDKVSAIQYRVKVNYTTQQYECECRDVTNNVNVEINFDTGYKTCDWILHALNTLMDQQLEVLKMTIAANAWNATLNLRRSTGVEGQRNFGRNPNHSTSVQEIPVVEAVPVHESVTL